mmetsp:Transcript_1616/g.2859  ORF Transcript_1616/g.2859 Transcript_1616/m.2859 type:complete len:129 (-) Transcript_1616:1326-1712(-)
MNPDADRQYYMQDVRTSELLDDQNLVPESSKKDGFYRTLFHQHTRYLDSNDDKEEMIRENELNFIQGYNSPVGPIKYMSPEAKEKVHQEISQRMQELEETGLTRFEILFEKQKGLKLQDDPFFQYVKN